MTNGSSFELMTDEQSGDPTATNSNKSSTLGAQGGEGGDIPLKQGMAKRPLPNEGAGPSGASQFISDESAGDIPIPLSGGGNMSKATGWSMDFDFGEALKDAVRKVPPEDGDNEFGFTATVTRIVGNFSRGFVPAHLEVTIQRGKHDKQPTEGKQPTDGRAGITNGTNAATQQRQPNDFTLEGQSKQIHFAATTFPGVPFLSYKDEENEGNNREFRGDEIDIQEKTFGKLVTVAIEHVPDSHEVYLTLLLPTVYLPQESREFPVKTIAIVATHQTPFTLPQGNANGRQVDKYDTLALEGTARLIIT